MIFGRYRTTLVLSIFIIAALFRFTDLSRRPMHGDEAINALMLADVVETGHFDYKPTQHHGPMLYYAGALFSFFHGLSNIQDFSESFLRGIAALVGLLLLWFGFCFRKSLKDNVILLAIGLMAVSPSLVFFSRYFIHENFVVLFSFGLIASGYQYLETKKTVWLSLVGVALGCLISTKETWSIILFSMGSSGAILYFNNGVKPIISSKQILTIVGIAIGTVFLFYSDFLRDINHSTDFFLAFSPYLDRVSAEDIHNHPWFYYLNILFPFGYSGNLFHWGEGLLFLAFLMNIRVKNQPVFIQFLFWYSLIMLAVISMIPYKTPWNILGIIPGVIIVASYTIYHELGKPLLRYGIIGGLIGIISLQAYSYNLMNESNPNNPHIYAHPTKDVLTIESKIVDIAESLPENVEFSVYVMATDDDYWPFPWYFRHFENVGYWNHVPDEVISTSIILISPDLETDLLKVLYVDAKPGEASLYIPLFDNKMELRPGVEILSFIKKDIYDVFQNTEATSE